MSFSVALLAAIGAFQAVPQETADPDALPDVVVEGRRLDEATRDFVGQVAAPPRGRGLALWRGRLCVGAVGFQREAGQYLVDRVSTVAEDLGVDIGDPGCTPNVIIAGAEDGQAMARELVGRERRAFDTNISGANRPDGALEDFIGSTRPIRWWHVSLPIDSETGAPAVRIPGQCTGSCDSIYDYAPTLAVNAASRLNSQIRDDLQKVIVVIDVDALGNASFTQIADYVSMIALAQVDPQADTRGFNTILNLFQPTVAVDEYLTDWDLAYLRGLYSADQTEVDGRRNARAVADAMADARLDAPEAY
ncbi:hypothetical protein IP78_14565 [Brevundimonas sp. AAP58]|uniref:hypothetical protein n=1 Tax=Brevundimonas sp. AAP58 TaxID=1523422 RepID=UPI0006B9C928|nr:hypothetical protein [Brevundimonas sp. AAP58]KPF73937.1 hypothetical protein IP78_14565 [Brevundimonas sp. AAP58]